MAEVAPEDAALVVDASRCRGLDAGEVGRLLATELATVAETGGIAAPLTVELACRGDVIEIAVRDPVTRKRLAREIPAPQPGAEGRERTVALAISQLFVASWLELLMPAERRPEPKGPPPRTVTAAREAARTAIEGPSRRTGDLHLGVGARFTALDRDPLPVVHTELGGIAWLHPSWGLLASVAYQGGSATRSVGSVRADAVLAGLGAAFRWPRDHVVALHAIASVEAGYMRFAGKPSAGAVAGPPTDGIGGGVGLAVGPRVRAGPVHASMLGSIGFTLRTPEALVSRGSTVVGDTTVYDLDDPVSLGGLWAGATLRVGLELGGP